MKTLMVYTVYLNEDEEVQADLDVNEGISDDDARYFLMQGMDQLSPLPRIELGEEEINDLEMLQAVLESAASTKH